MISISGLVAGAARALAVAALQRETGKTFAVVSQSTRDLESWERDLRFWRIVLQSSDILVSKMMATAMLNRHFEWGNLVLRTLSSTKRPTI